MARREIITGEVTLPQIHRQLIDAHGLTLTYPQFEAAWLEPNSWPMPGMAEFVKALSENHRLVLLSNVDHYYWQVVRVMQPELEFFTDLLVSCDLGSAKPESEAFLCASQAAGADPAQCLFVDDTRTNLEAARALAFQTLVPRCSRATRDPARRDDKGLLASAPGHGAAREPPWPTRPIAAHLKLVCRCAFGPAEPSTLPPPLPYVPKFSAEVARHVS